MKRVLLIEIHPDCEIGGAETYNRQLSEILNEQYPNVQIDKCCYFDFDHENSKTIKQNNDHYFILKDNVKKVNGKYSLFSKALAIIKFRKFVYNLLAQNHYDLIIDSTITYFKKICHDDNYFWVQHMTPQFYDLTIFPFWKRLIYKLAWFCLGVKNNLIVAKNLVLYDVANETYIHAHRQTSFNAFDIALCYDVPKNYLSRIDNNCEKKKGIIYFGRIDAAQKNIRVINEINKQIHLIDFYGAGNQELINGLGESYKGYILPDADLQQLFAKYKFLILMSNYEGFSYSIVQALSYGVPIIVKDSFISAKYLVNNGNNGLLLPATTSVDEYCKLIKNFYNLDQSKYLQLCENAYKFALDNLDNKVFKAKWMKIFDKYLH